MNPRLVAVNVLTQVIVRKKSLSNILPTATQQITDARDVALARELIHGVLRWYYVLDFLLSQLLQKPLKEKDSNIKHLIFIGLYQIKYLRVPEYAAVSETVVVCRQLKKKWALSLVNGVLRSYLRRSSDLVLLLNSNITAQYSHAPWLIKCLQRDWPDAFDAILNANNCRPPMMIRVNLRRITRDDYLVRLQQAGINATPVALVASAIKLEAPMPATELPEFQQGWVSVQDAAAQLAANLLMLAPGQRVLDACAAPGGKTTHILETEPALQKLVALDHDKERLQKVEENLNRLTLTAELCHADVIQVAQWSDGQTFDRILLDVPCSATGVIRRHPDIKLLRVSQDIQPLVDNQRAILATLWPLLKRGGILLYVTCSVLKCENEQQIIDFLQEHQDAKELPIVSEWGRQRGGRQIFPGENDMDGFYYARLQKI